MRSRRLPFSRYAKSIATQFVSVETTNIPASEESHQAQIFAAPGQKHTFKVQAVFKRLQHAQSILNLNFIEFFIRVMFCKRVSIKKC